MKNLFLILTILISGVSIAQCSVNTFIQDNYEFDAKLLALRDILSDPMDPDHFNPFIPDARFTPYLEKLSAIYENPNNVPQITALFDDFQIHVNQEYNFPIEFETIAFSVDTNVSWVEDFKNTGISGVAALDQLISTYQFSLDNFWEFGSCSCTIFFIKTDIEFLNLNAIIGDFNDISVLNYAEIYMDDIDLRFNYTGIPYSINNEPVTVADIIISDDIYTFTLYSGDCFAGCLYGISWQVEVSESCEVTFLSVPENSISEVSLYPNPVSEILYFQNLPPGDHSIKVYSLQGQLIKFNDFSSEEINVADLTAGVYFIEISTVDGSKEVLRFVKK
jgi:hypothetical protein